MARLVAIGMLVGVLCLSLTCVHCSGFLAGPVVSGDGASWDGGPPKADREKVPPNPGKKTYYVRPKGGSRSQCTGQTNADYPGSGANQPCAFNHPFQALSPRGTPLLKGGDTLIIAGGSYRMGVGAPGAGGCQTAYPWDCTMPAIPSGTAAGPTRILGEGWSSGCKSAPKLYGVERAYQIFDLRGSSHVKLQCLEITDRSSCVEHHATSALRCDRGSAPYGDWSAVGIRAADSSGVLLKHVNIHGMAHTGINAGRLKDWTLEDSRIAGNGWAGWDGDINQGSSSNSGQMTFRRVSIDWNGCGESYPGGKPVGCWGQSAGGYGDGLGTAATGGDWTFEDCRFRHNTSDGLDLLYHSKGGSIVIKRMRAEGNAGNQVKVTGNATIVNSVLVGNCAYFKGKSFTHNVDHCRALGNTVELTYQAGKKVTLINNTIYGDGDVLVDVGVRQGYSCDGSETLTAVNNIFVGGTDYHQPSERPALYYREGCNGLKFKADYGVAHNVKGTCKYGPNDLCKDPRIGPFSGDVYGMTPKKGSPAIDSGKSGGGVPAIDFNLHKRPAGSGVDRGAIEQ